MSRVEKPIDTSRGPVAELAAELRLLRYQAGRPSYRQLAAAAGYSPAVLSQAAAGRRLPSWPVVKAYVEACGGDVEQWQHRWRRTQGSQENAEAASAHAHAERLLQLLDQAAGPSPDPVCQSTERVLEPREGPREEGRRKACAIKVFIVDDHEIVRRGIRRLFDCEPDIEVVGEAPNAAVALAAIPVLRPQVAILDVRLPDGDGVTVCRDIRSATEPPPACLMLTSYSDDEALFGAIMAGAAAYMIKQVSGNDIVAAVRTLGTGGSLLDAEVTATVLNRLRPASAEDPRYRSLSPQERKILDLIATGRTNRQIAAELFLAEKTVKQYVSTLLHKLGFDRRTEAAVYATRLRQGLRADLGS